MFYGLFHPDKGRDVWLFRVLDHFTGDIFYSKTVKKNNFILDDIMYVPHNSSTIAQGRHYIVLTGYPA